ncbi:FkbM family methyltransferase [Rhodoplanes serenus]|uniref:FkbM family methyltransferase n=1 Tax=Rhodoplanes serenus TaxID=200615 RepID=UPI000DAF1769|nr:FkbM family methyltransferase [Rhodoplanes serenus]RAI33223.1 hypothetical protein CH340_12940 [Rhodoplanes serenus]
MSDEAFVIAMYKGLLGREPDKVGLASHLASIREGSSYRDVVRAFIESQEYSEIHTKPPSFDFAARLSRPLCIVDVGAQELANEEHVYAPLLQSRLRTRCIGFEPLADRLEERRASSGEIELFPYCIGDGSPATLYVNNDDATSSLLPLNSSFVKDYNHLRQLRTVDRKPVETTRLDDALRDVAHVDFLKLDIQGAEAAALQGGSEVLGRTNVVHCEVEFAPIYDQQPRFSEIELLLRNAGFELIDLQSLTRYWFESVPMRQPSGERLIWGEAVFFKVFHDCMLPDANDALAQAAIAVHVYRKPGLAQHILLRAGLQAIIS